jgi:hypothetical protein
MSVSDEAKRAKISFLAKKQTLIIEISLFVIFSDHRIFRQVADIWKSSEEMLMKSWKVVKSNIVSSYEFNVVYVRRILHEVVVYRINNLDIYDISQHESNYHREVACSFDDINWLSYFDEMTELEVNANINSKLYRLIEKTHNSNKKIHDLERKMYNLNIVVIDD